MDSNHDDLVTFIDLPQVTMVTEASELTDLPLYPYGFNPDLYHDVKSTNNTDPEPQLKPSQDFISLIANEIGVANEALYITGAIILVIALIFIIALITN